MQFALALRLPRVQIGFTRIDVLELALEAGDALLGGEVSHEERIAQEDGQDEARDDEQPRQSAFRSVGHDAGILAKFAIMRLWSFGASSMARYERASAI